MDADQTLRVSALTRSASSATPTFKRRAASYVAIIWYKRPIVRPQHHQAPWVSPKTARKETQNATPMLWLDALPRPSQFLLPYTLVLGLVIGQLAACGLSG